MASTTFNSGEVIDLVSSDVEAATATKKRPLEDDSDNKSPPAGSNPERRSKRKRVKSPTKLDAVSPTSLKAEDGEVDEMKPGKKAKGSPVDETQQDRTTNGETVVAGVKQPATSKPTTAGWNPGISKVVMRTSLSKTTTDTAAPATKSLPTFQKGKFNFKIPSLPEKMEGTWFARYKQWVLDFFQCNSESSRGFTSGAILASYEHYLDIYTSMKAKKKRSAKQAARELHKTGVIGNMIKSTRGSSAAKQTAEPAELSNLESKADSSHVSSEMEDDVLHLTGEDEDDDDDEEEEEAAPAPAAVAAAPDSDVEYEPWPSKPEQAAVPVPSATERAAQTTPNGPSPLQQAIPTGNLALEQQRKYFPSASDPSTMCLLCGRENHIAANCPDLGCRFCGNNSHLDLCCPLRARCSNCRQLGHRPAQCTEKLALTKDEGLACCFCDAADHLEDLCTDMWRSFHPDETNIRKVTLIPASCSLCGSGSHFSADCDHRQGIFSNPTWSLKNRDRYVDPGCDAASIEPVTGGANGMATGGPELRIRGHAARTTNVYFSESDSDAEFLGKPAVKPRAQVGQIRMSSNIQMPQGSNSRGANEQSKGHNLRDRGQPPLPPGPPLAGPPSRQGSYGQQGYGSRPSGPPTSLPPKPPAPSRDYRGVPPPQELQESRGQPWKPRDSGNASRGGKTRGAQRGGHGGRGGRGRGRGRGK